MTGQSDGIADEVGNPTIMCRRMKTDGGAENFKQLMSGSDEYPFCKIYYIGGYGIITGDKYGFNFTIWISEMKGCLSTRAIIAD